MDRPANGVEDVTEVVTGRRLEADGAMNRPANGVEDGAEVATGRRLEADGTEVVTGRRRPEADGADGSVPKLPINGAALARPRSPLCVISLGAMDAGADAVIAATISF
jgi:hypothetical protein